MIDESNINPPSLSELFRDNQSLMQPVLSHKQAFMMATSPVNFAGSNPQLQAALNPQEPIEVLGEKALNSINLPGQLPSMVGGIKFEGNDVATLGLRTMETVAEFGGAVFGALTDKPDPMEELKADLEAKLQINMAPRPPQMGSPGVGFSGGMG